MPLHHLKNQLYKLSLSAVTTGFLWLLAIPTTSAAVYDLAYNSDLIGEIEVIHNERNESFTTLAERHGVSFSELVAANPQLDPWVPGKTSVVIPNQHILPAGPREGVVINLAELRLYYFEPNSNRVHTYPVGIGKQGWRTPKASTRITQRKRDPEWRAPASIIAAYAKRGKAIRHVIPPGPDNPLGKYALRLALPGYLIHGTNNHKGVGRRVSHGCIRMYANDIEALYNLVQVGTPVRIVHQPHQVGMHQGKVYVHAAPEQMEYKTSLDERHQEVLEMVEQLKPNIPSYIKERLDLPVLKPALRLQNGIPLDLTEI